METIYNLSCSDRNRLALQSELLNASALGLDNVLILQGDPPSLGDHYDAKPVSDLDVLGLLGAAKRLQEGYDLMGNELKGKPEFCVGTQIHLKTKGHDLDFAVTDLEKRIGLGVHFFFISSVYDVSLFETFIKKVAPFKVPIIAGVTLLKSVGMARYINKHVEGASIPETVMEKLTKASNKQEASIEIAKEMIHQVKTPLSGDPDHSDWMGAAHPCGPRPGRLVNWQPINRHRGGAEKGMETRKTRLSMKERRLPRPATQPHQDASRHFEKIVEMGNDGIFVFDEHSKIVFANQMASEITGIPREDLIGKNFFTVIGKQDKDFLEGPFIREEALGQKLCIEMGITTPQGQFKDAEVCLASAKSDEGDVKTYAYIRDITERRRFEKDLRDSEEKLRTLFERVRHGLFISSKEGRFIECNQALLDMLGYSNKKDLIRRDLPQDVYVNPEDRDTFMERVEREGYVKDMEVEFKKKNGEKITVALTAYPIRNDKGEIVGYEGINLDITERKRIEEELREDERILHEPD